MKQDETLTFSQEEIFSPDPDNPKNIRLKIPDEMLKAKGWGEGTKIKVNIGDQGTIIIEEVKEESESKSESPGKVSSKT